MLRSRLRSRSQQELAPRLRSIYDTLSGRDLVTRCSPPMTWPRFRDADHARQLGETRSISPPAPAFLSSPRCFEAVRKCPWRALTLGERLPLASAYPWRAL